MRVQFGMISSVIRQLFRRSSFMGLMKRPSMEKDDEQRYSIPPLPEQADGYVRSAHPVCCYPGR